MVYSQDSISSSRTKQEHEKQSTFYKNPTQKERNEAIVDMFFSLLHADAKNGIYILMEKKIKISKG